MPNNQLPRPNIPTPSQSGSKPGAPITGLPNAKPSSGGGSVPAVEVSPAVKSPAVEVSPAAAVCPVVESPLVE